MDKNSNFCFIISEMYLEYTRPEYKYCRNIMLRTTLPLPYPGKMFITGHGIFSEKIALLKQLSESTNSLIMITLNHLVIQNESQKLVLEINFVTKPENPTFDEKE